MNDSFVSLTDVNGGIKELTSQKCIIRYCPGIFKLYEGIAVLVVIYIFQLYISMPTIIEYIHISIIKSIVNGAIGLSVTALKHVEKEQELIQEDPKL